MKNRNRVDVGLLDLLYSRLVEVGLASVGDFVQKCGSHIKLWVQVDYSFFVVAEPVQRSPCVPFSDGSELFDLDLPPAASNTNAP